MRTATYHGTDYEITFSGAAGESLCIDHTAGEPKPLRVLTRADVDLSADTEKSRAYLRERMMKLFLLRDTWTVADLRAAMKVDPIVVNGLIQRAKQYGLIKSVSYGVVKAIQ